MNLYTRRKRGRNAVTHPMVHRLQELDLVESWATYLLKLMGKFGLHLTEFPTSIYQEIPPFCPKTSMIYRQFEQFAPRPYFLAVEGLSKTTWDNGLAKISVRLAFTTGSIVRLLVDLSASSAILFYPTSDYKLSVLLDNA
ncbi:unnamed protein product [Penicillium viridicatum]